MNTQVVRWRLQAVSLAFVCATGASVFAQVTVPDGPITSTLPGLAADEIVASVGNHDIRRHEIDRRWREQDPPGFARVQQHIQEAYTRALDALIGDRLLEQEADRQRVTVVELLDRVDESAEAPTAGEIRDLFEQSSASAQGLTLDVASPLISGYLKQQKGIAARRQYIDQLRRSTPLNIKLPIESWRQTIAIEAGEPYRGVEAASVEVVEFSDFQCPYCRRTTPILKEVLSKYSGKVKQVWKDFPLPMHQAARGAAEAAQCANEQGKFWEYHDLLFGNQAALTTPDLKKYAAGVGVNLDAFSSCIDSRKFAGRVSAGIEQGTRLGVSATPTVFINGRMITGVVPLEVYDRMIREELALGKARPTP